MLSQDYRYDKLRETFGDFLRSYSKLLSTFGAVPFQEQRESPILSFTAILFTNEEGSNVHLISFHWGGGQ